LLFCENLAAHSQEFLRSDPNLERVAETVLRIEETVSDEVEVPLWDMGASAVIGPALDARVFPAARGSPDPLVDSLRPAMQALLDRMLKQGPPAEWPRPATGISSTTPRGLRIDEGSLADSSAADAPSSPIRGRSSN
jgi:hypothetical protein